jgi:hypothetical protein
MPAGGFMKSGMRFLFVFAAAAVCLLLPGCYDPYPYSYPYSTPTPTPTPTPVPVGSLTITGVTGGQWNVYAVYSDPASYSQVASTLLSAPGIGTIFGGQTTVTWVTTPPSGTYTIIMAPQGGGDIKKMSYVSYPGAVDISTFSVLPPY